MLNSSNFVYLAKNKTIHIDNEETIKAYEGKYKK